MNQLSTRLKLLRTNKKIYQKNLAELLQVTVRQYQRYENGEQEPNIDSLIILSKYFNVSIDYLVGNDNPEVNK